MWNEQPGRLLLFTIHHMDKLAPKFIDAIHRINNSGYDGDYISDNFIRSTRFKDGQLVTSGGTGYKALVVPAAHLMPSDVLAHLYELAKQELLSYSSKIIRQMYRDTVSWNKNAKVTSVRSGNFRLFLSRKQPLLQSERGRLSQERIMHAHWPAAIFLPKK